MSKSRESDLAFCAQCAKADADDKPRIEEDAPTGREGGAREGRTREKSEGETWPRDWIYLV